MENSSFFVSWIFAGTVVFISTISMVFIRRFDHEKQNEILSVKDRSGNPAP